MNIAKKLAIGVALAAALMAGTASAKDIKIGLVVKSLGNGFFEAANKGAQEAAKDLGGVQVIYTGPTSTTAEGQIEVINSLIAQGVDAIAISANDPDAVPLDIDWSDAVLIIPPKKQAISIRVDEDVLNFFKKQGDGYQRRINAVLRSYMQQKAKPKKRA